MGREAARLSIVAAIEAAKVGAPTNPLVIEYDNRIVVDTNSQILPFIGVKILFMDGKQADISDHPTHRIWGQIHLAVASKEGSGSSEANKLLDHFFPQLQRKQFGAVRTLMATMAPDKTHNGWVYSPVLIPFWFDTIY